ncbi:hypothetical protein EON82_04545 [bacterium]|nr:MAG: hypothetical protein EON82_04545 [bacterium]
MAIVGVGLAEVWWKRTTPPERNFFPFPAYDTMIAGSNNVRLYEGAWPSRIGYSDEQRAENTRRGKRFAAVMTHFTDELEAKRKAGMPYADLVAYRLAHEVEVFDRAIGAAGGSLQRFTDAQELQLRPLLLQTYGPWLLADRELSRRLGLSERQRQFVEDLNWSLYRQYNTWRIESEISLQALQGATSDLSASRRLLSQYSLGVYEHWAASDPEREARERQLRELEMNSTSKTAFTLPKWVRDHWDDAVRRRTSGLRFQMESLILQQLSPEQHQRWNVYRSGS